MKDDCVIICDYCESEFQISCVGISKTAFKSISKSKSFSWKCLLCLKKTSLLPDCSEKRRKSFQSLQGHADDDSCYDDKHLLKIIICSFCCALVDGNGFCCTVCNQWSHWGCYDLDDFAMHLEQLKDNNRIIHCTCLQKLQFIQYFISFLTSETA